MRDYDVPDYESFVKSSVVGLVGLLVAALVVLLLRRMIGESRRVAGNSAKKAAKR